MLRPLALSALLMTSPVYAQSIIVGLGSDNFDDGPEAASFLLESRYDVFSNLGPFELRSGAALEVDEDGDAWVGFGVFANAPLTENLDFVTSFAPGLYERGDGEDLGGTVEFRTQVGLSYDMGKSSIGFVVEHKSNAGLYDRNPGVNSVYLTYGIDF
ncbi:acyloxyacyl hydrolase [Pontivivens insulae]|uniref:Acyloxyacyl hydrolase n=1 Tax=Pontivivens insulae TaxID=1639689 RepID=A0A2R8A7Z3_9RHOB|nr:acyloxyacyl hydrolase [Pontivivens insulae]RED18444.1 lipid A 3-O-deacylase PagL [Pontivivens insulae]SPF28342.1 hypothetical protein POI8812_00640 [Pontivivens insulae]